ncbi:MAG: AsmA family protein [candidate division WOR-3 bacterium]
MRRFLKILIFVLSVLILCFILFYVTIRLTLNEKQIRFLAEKSLSQAIKREVELGRIRIRLGWGLKIEIHDVKIANATGFSNEPMLQINTAQFSLQLMSLFKKMIVVNEIMIQEARLLIERDKNHNYNLPSFTQDSSIKPLDKKPKPWQWSLDRIDIRDAIVDFRDSVSQTRMLLSNIKQEVIFIPNTIGISGLADLEIFPPNKELGTFYFKINNNLKISPGDKRISVQALDLAWPPLTLALNGDISNFNELNLSGKLHLTDFDRIISLLNRQLANRLKIKGGFGVSFQIIGPVSNPDLEGVAELSDVSVSYHPTKVTIDKIYGGFSFNREQIRDIKINGMAGNMHLKMTGNIDTLARPRLNLNLSIDGNLTELRGSFPEIEKLGIGGSISSNIKVVGRDKNLRYVGSASLINGQINNPGGIKPITDININCDFKNDTVLIKEASLKVTQSDLRTKGKVTNFKKPKIEITGTSERFNFDEILIPQKSSSSQGKPPALTLQARLDINNLTFYNIQSTKARVNVLYNDGILLIRSTSFDAYNGQVAGEADFDFNSTPVKHQINVSVNNVEANLILKQFANFEGLTGKMNGRGVFSGSGFSPRDMKTTFTANGHAVLRQGAFVNCNFTTKLLSWLALGESKTLNFEDLGTEFKIQNGRVRFDDLICATRIGDFLIFGSLGFDGDVDYKINLKLSKEASTKFKSVHGDWLFYTDETGRIIVDILATGTLAAPQFKLDNEKIKKRLEKKIEDETKKEIEKIKKKLKDWWKKK